MRIDCGSSATTEQQVESCLVVVVDEDVHGQSPNTRVLIRLLRTWITLILGASEQKFLDSLLY
jgi:hypothetical protein